MTQSNVRAAFERHFNTHGTLYASAGRINLIGEHTDYNGGFVFPGAVDCGITAMIRPNGTDRVRAYAVDLDSYALNDLYALGIDKFELARIGQSTEHNYCGVKCGIMDQFASVFGKKGCLMRLDCRSMEFEYFPFDPVGYKLVLLDTVVKHELVGSPYNRRRESCERVAKMLGQEFLRGATMERLDAIRDEISDEDYRRARFVIGEERRVLDVCDALQRGDYATVGERMYATHEGLSKDYEVSCEELDFLVDVARECGVTGARMMGGGFGGCTINLVKDDLFADFIATAKRKFTERFGHEPKVYPVVISDGAHKID